MMRRYLGQMSVDDELPQLIKTVSRFKTNEEFLKYLNVNQ
jgi:transcription termination factor Rho